MNAIAARPGGTAFRFWRMPLALIAVASAQLAPLSPAHAGFQYDAPGAGDTAPPAAAQSQPTTLTPALPRALIRASGHDMPLAAALRILVPPSLTVAPLSPDVRSRTVTFRGIARPWDVVLPEAMKSAGLAARISGQTVTIVLAGSPLASQPVIDVALATPVSSDASHPASSAASGLPAWIVKDGSSLELTLADWTARMGWKLVWHAKDDNGRKLTWPVESGGTLHGNWLPQDATDHSVVEDLLAGFDKAPRRPHVTMSTKFQQLEVTVEGQ